MLNFFKKLFGGGKSAQSKPAGRDSARPSPAANDSGGRNMDIPNRLSVGLEMRAVPEKQPGTPRAWTVKIVRLDSEGIWLARVPKEEQPVPVQPKEMLCLVVFDQRKQLTYDCPVLRIKPGQPEQILVGPPIKSLQEESKVTASGGRKHFRVAFRLPAELRVVTGGQVGPALACHTRDISMGGLALDCSQSIESGRVLDVRVLSWNFPLTVRARVVRTFQTTAGVYSVALEFPEDLSQVTRDLISQFILENQKR